MKAAELARRLRKAQGWLDDGERGGKYAFICHTIQLGVRGEALADAFNSNPKLPEVALLVEMGMPLGVRGFLDLDCGIARQGARFMLLELAALLAEDGVRHQVHPPAI